MANKYALADPEVSSTLAKLQLLPDLSSSAHTASVPLPPRTPNSSKERTAFAIRDGRRAVQRLAVLGRISKGSSASGRSISGTSSNRFSGRRASVCLSTVLEQDFTIPGKMSSLLCPYVAQPEPAKTIHGPRTSQGGSTMESNNPLTPSDSKDQTPHHSADPICAAMYAETMNSPPPSVTGSAAKCPIRYLDQHSPEEVARYFETHKHEIPRSHEVCVKRYQRNEQDIRKLDAKYGNLVNMIQGLGQKHQPMLQVKGEVEEDDNEHMSNERVETWAQAVSADGVGDEEVIQIPVEEDDRESRFDRPLKEVRVGESPSRPWGISVPVLDPPTEEQRAYSPPPAPVSHAQAGGRCPFGFNQEQKLEPATAPASDTAKPVGKCPFPKNQDEKEKSVPQNSPVPASQPVFVQPEVAKVGGNVPQMVFTGPVFIGYPIDQAMALMQQWKSTQ